MTTRRLSFIGIGGSVGAFALTFCAFPWMLFGTKTVARAAWFVGLISAGAFALLLLGTLVMSVILVAKKKLPMRNGLLPAIPLVLVYVTWWRFIVWISRME